MGDDNELRPPKSKRREPPNRPAMPPSVPRREFGREFGGVPDRNAVPGREDACSAARRVTKPEGSQPGPIIAAWLMLVYFMMLSDPSNLRASGVFRVRIAFRLSR